ncbi:hypothetical protein MTR_1g048730 [Medicago truncatula]|uniref:Uncharacterized protein n=1 Tax=Medicago truncatula TaxID=3880 RepID=A0A072VH22_MEDTR|nr:hypothetical protein MTR_1g048730 [Medicago truncatula]
MNENYKIRTWVIASYATAHGPWPPAVVKLLLTEKSWSNIRAINANLILFKIIYSTKVNFQKRLLVSIDVEESWLLEASMVLKYKDAEMRRLGWELREMGGDGG